ncbi:MAG: sodium:calcium antiporter [Nocardioidaceae bacterium]
MPEILLSAVLLVAGAGVLTAGAEAFAEHVTAAASRLGVSVLALGVLLAGAEPEEAVTAMLAAGQGHPGLAAGDAIGANLVILTLTVGLAALLAPLPVGRRVVQYAVAAAAAGALAVGLMADGVLGRVEGTALVLLYGAGVLWVWRREQAPPLIGELAELAEADEADEAAGADRRRETQRRALVLVLLGLLGMLAGGFLAVRGAEALVDAIGATESVVGLTVLALATSAEMLALVLAAHRRGLTEIALAGAVGSVAYNATTTLGLAAWVDPLVLGPGDPVVTIGVVTAALPLVVLTGRRSGHLPRPIGVLLALGYVGAVGWLVVR